jgi:hypothetical protein
MRAKARASEPRYGVFVRFRRTRLTMKRGIEDLAEALEFARQVRALRFHDPESVVVLREPDGVAVDECPPASGVTLRTYDPLPDSPPAPAEDVVHVSGSWSIAPPEDLPREAPCAAVPSERLVSANAAKARAEQAHARFAELLQAAEARRTALFTRSPEVQRAHEKLNDLAAQMEEVLRTAGQIMSTLHRPR